MKEFNCSACGNFAPYLMDNLCIDCFNKRSTKVAAAQGKALRWAFGKIEDAFKKEDRNELL